MSDVRSVEDCFGELIELETAELRADYLKRIGSEDAILLEQLEKLLEAHEKAGSFLHQDSFETTREFEPDSLLNSSIGPYKLRERLGAGGMGVVWAAEQRLPLKRKVALKLIKPGMDSEQVIARFEAEREALSRMDHPNIARVLDAGTTEKGHPYFVMELIRGVPVTEYCDKKRLTIRERLELFTKICSAVQHAHQKGIIHRDIKPSNVLVSEQDGQPIPKVIDFGVAKALHQPLTDRSLYTGVFQALGTLQYMSPEQAGLSIADVDTRADVYGLGVLLYELLTGSTPFEKEQLASAAFDEACRIIREQEPPKPSTRLSTLGERALTISQTRNTDPHQLSRLVRGDLDWIVTKSLDKDRNRRYESAMSLADDVNRFLQNVPIEARPPSTWYQLRKVLSRNRSFAVSISAVLIALCAGLSFAFWQLLEKEEAIRAKETALGKLRIVATGDALNLALMARVEQTEQAIELLEEAGAEDGLGNALRGLARLYAGDAATARNYFDQATNANPDSIPAWSGMWLAALYTGEYEEMSNARAHLLLADSKKRPAERSDVDRILLAQLNRHTAPESTVLELERLLKSHPSWGGAYSLLARAQINAAKDSWQESDTLQRFQRALENFETASNLTLKSEFVSTDYLLGLLEACEYAQDAGGLDEEVANWMNRADEIYGELGEPKIYGGYGFKARTAYLAARGNAVRLQELNEKIRAAPGCPACLKVSNLLIDGRIDEAMAMIDGEEDLDTETQAVLKLLCYAVQPDRKSDAIALYEAQFQSISNASDIAYFSMDAFLVMGDYERTKKEANRMRGKADHGSGRWNRRVLDYLADQSPESERNLLRKSGPFLREQAIAYFAIGLVAMANNKNERAIECFERVLKSGFLDNWHYVWADAYRKKLLSEASVIFGEGPGGKY